MHANARLSLFCLFAGFLPAQTTNPVVVPIDLTPHADVRGTNQTISFGLPLPAGFLVDTTKVRVVDTYGNEVPAFVRSLGPWRSIPPAGVGCGPQATVPGIRSILVQFQALVPDDPWQVRVELNVPRTLNLPGGETPVRSTWRLVNEGSYSAGNNIREPSVFATMTPQWLTCSGLLPYSSPAGAYAFMKVPLDDPMAAFWPHMVNQFNDYPAAREKIDYLQDYEPWLYDRAQSFFQLYVRTGRVDVLREAHRAAQHYESLLYRAADCLPAGACRGQFSLRVPTPSSTFHAMYSYTASLASDYWLTGDPEALVRIPDASFASVSSALPAATWTQPLQFTERNFAVALYGLAHDYDVTGNEASRMQAATVLDALEGMQNTPAAGVPSNGCFHYRPEEAFGEMGFSPWMSALLGHGLFRAWETFGETRASAMLSKLALCVAERGVAAPYATTSPAYWYTRYLGTSSGPLEFAPGDPWADGEHSVDTAYLLALGARFTAAGPDRDRLVLMAHRMLRSQQLTLSRSYRPNGYPGNGLALYSMDPPRKYGWWFTQSPALGRLLGEGDPELAALGLAMPFVQGGVTLDGDVALLGPAPAGGKTVGIVSSRPDLAAVPANVLVDEGQAYAVFPVVTAPVGDPTDVVLTATLDGVSRSITITLQPPALARIVRTASVVGGGGSTSARVELHGPAPAGGLLVTISNHSPGLLSLPASLTFPAGAVSGTFGIGTQPVATQQTGTYSVTGAGSSLSSSLSVQPLALSRVSSPASMARGVTITTASVQLNGPAPAGGLVVALVSSAADSLIVPPSATIAAGTTSKTFSISSPVGGTAPTATITATLAGVVRTTTVTFQTGVLATILLKPATVKGNTTTSQHTVSLTAVAPPGGVSVNLTSQDPAQVTVPATVLVPAGASSKAFSIVTASTASLNKVTIVAESGDEQRAAPLTVEPDQLALLSLSAATVAGGTTLQSNLVQLPAPAPAGGAVVQLTSSNPAVATVPPTVTVPAGQSSAPFEITAKVVTADQTVTIQASYGTATGSASLRVLGLSLVAVVLTQANTPGGGTLSGNTVQIGATAPAGGVPVLLESSNASVSVPPSVVIAAGQTSASFSITSQAVDAPTEVTITARLGAQSRNAVVTLTVVFPDAVTFPAKSLAGGLVYAGNTVRLNRAAPTGGITVQLASSDASAAGVPASVFVAGGATAATFSITTYPVRSLTAVTIQAFAGGGSASGEVSVRAPVLTGLLLGASTSAPGMTYATNRVVLNSDAPAGGLTVALTSTNQAMLPVPAPFLVPAGARVGVFPLTIAANAPSGTYRVTAQLDGVTIEDTIMVEGAAGGSLTALTLAPVSVIGGVTTTSNKVTINVPAPAEGTVVMLVSSLPGVASVPASVTIASGQSSVTFPIVSTPVATERVVVVTASAGGTTRTANVTVKPPALSSVTVYPSGLIGGRSTTQSKVILNGLAPAGGLVVQLSSLNPAAVQVPGSVTVPEGQSTAIYTAVTQPVPVATPVTVQATLGTVNKSAVLTVAPPTLSSFVAAPTTVAASTTTTGHLVKLTGAAPTGGIVVALVSANQPVLSAPSSVTVPAGATQVNVPLTSGSPAALTSVTVTATSGTISKIVTVKVSPPK